MIVQQANEEEIIDLAKNYPSLYIRTTTVLFWRSGINTLSQETKKLLASARPINLLISGPLNMPGHDAPHVL